MDKINSSQNPKGSASAQLPECLPNILIKLSLTDTTKQNPQHNLQLYILALITLSQVLNKRKIKLKFNPGKINL